MIHTITHPLADEISVVKEGPGGMRAYAGESSSEIAFFLDGEWVVEPIAPFEEYHDGSTSDTAVYGWVPDTLIEKFLEEYGVSS